MILIPIPHKAIIEKPNQRHSKSHPKAVWVLFDRHSRIFVVLLLSMLSLSLLVSHVELNCSKTSSSMVKSSRPLATVDVDRTVIVLLSPMTDSGYLMVLEPLPMKKKA